MTAPQFTSQFIDAALDQAFKAATDKRIAVMDEIIEKVAARSGVTAEDLKGPVRLRRLFVPRAIAMWTCRQQGISYQVIGDHFGFRHHNTVHNAVKHIDEKIEAMK